MEEDRGDVAEVRENMMLEAGRSPGGLCGENKEEGGEGWSKPDRKEDDQGRPHQKTIISKLWESSLKEHNSYIAA